MTLKSHIGKLRKNKRGGIEGLPLQLMIIILVAALGTAIIVGWMSSIDTPKSIRAVEADPGSINGTSDIDVTIKVTDQDGNPLDGATVVLTGYGITDGDGRTPNAVTGSDGAAHFAGLNIKNLGSSVGYIDAQAMKPGYSGKTIQIVVIR
jgi:hypothetical protein